MIEFRYKIDFKKGEEGIEAFNNKKSVQGECAMALLALERFKEALLDIEYDDATLEFSDEEEE